LPEKKKKWMDLTLPLKRRNPGVISSSKSKFYKRKGLPSSSVGFANSLGSTSWPYTFSLPNRREED